MAVYGLYLATRLFMYIYRPNIISDVFIEMSVVCKECKEFLSGMHYNIQFIMHN